MNIQTLQGKNPHIKIQELTPTNFKKYGKILDGYDFSGLCSVMEHRDIPKEGNVYVANDDEMHALPVSEKLSEHFYAHMPIQVGYCNGNSSKLNALEYHKGSEIDIAVTDLVLLLAPLQEISHNTLSSDVVEAFFLPAGSAVELYGTTLHFAPCKVTDAGFKSIIVLPEGTNAALDEIPAPIYEEDELLWMQNKWLIAHAESIPASKGAHVGVTGTNIEIFY